MTARCARCGHGSARHYADRSGAPLCVGPCGCDGYVAPPPAGLTAPAGCTPEQAHAAALALCDMAADPAEAADLLAMCGLLDDTTTSHDPRKATR